MKRSSALLAVALVAACGRNGEGDAGLAPVEVSKQLADAGQAAKEMQMFTFEQQTPFSAKLDRRMESLRIALHDLGAQVGEANGGGTVSVGALRDEMAALERQLIAVRGADRASWEGIKAEAISSFLALARGLDQARRGLTVTPSPHGASGDRPAADPPVRGPPLPGATPRGSG